MRKLSTGHDSTLGNYLILAKAVLGEESKAVSFLREKIQSSPNGENEEVVVAETQMIYLLCNL